MKIPGVLMLQRDVLIRIIGLHRFKSFPCFRIQDAFARFRIKLLSEIATSPIIII
jgi:hypothetical protein